MLEHMGKEIQVMIASMHSNMLFAFYVVGVLWLIHVINYLMQHNLNMLGIRPRKFKGLIGIVFAPFLHADFNHLFFNSIPLLALSDLILAQGRLAFYYVSVSIIILSGMLTWIFGRRGIQIGASGVIMGYFGYLLFNSYVHFSASSIALSGFCLYYFGGLFFALFPSIQKNISWEGHICGFISGIGTAYCLPKFLPIVLHKAINLLHIFA